MRLWNVRGCRRGVFLLLTVVLSACTKTQDLEVSFLSFSMPSLKSTGDSPFEQELHESGYVVLSGTCDPFVSSFQIQFNELSWAGIPPVRPDPVSGSYAPTGRTYSEAAPSDASYDVDCGDGDFRFYLYAHQIDEILIERGITEGSETNDIKTIRLRGIGGPFSTEPLVFTSPHSDGDGNTSAGEADDFHLYLTNMKFGIGVCMPAGISLRKGEAYNVSNSSEKKFSLHAESLRTAGSVAFYRDSSCETGVETDAGGPFIRIPAGERHAVFYVKGNTAEYQDPPSFPASPSLIASTESFGGQERPVNFEVRDAGLAAKMKFTDQTRSPAVGSCEDVSFVLLDENSVVTNLLPEGASVAVGAHVTAGSGITFHSSCSSSSAWGGAVFNEGGSPFGRLAYRVSSAAEKQIVLSAANASLSFEGPAHFVNPWTAADRAVLEDPFGPLGIPYQVPDCRTLRIRLVDSNGANQNQASSTFALDLTGWGNWPAAILFYPDPHCQGTAEAASSGRKTLSFAPGESVKEISWTLPQANYSYSYLNFGIDWSPRLTSPWATTGLSVPVVDNAVNYMGSIDSIWRIPRGSGMTNLTALPSVPELSAFAWDLVSVRAPEVAFFGEGAGRAVAQNVLHFSVDDSMSADLSLSMMSFTAAVMFRSDGSAGSEQVLLSSPDLNGKLSLTTDGNLQFLGCAAGDGWNYRDGQWHVVLVSRDSATEQVHISVDGGSITNCALGLLDRNGLSQLDVGDPSLLLLQAGFSGQIAEIILTQGSQHGSFHLLFDHFGKRYPAR